MAVTLHTPGKRGPDASDRAVRQRLCSEEIAQSPFCQPLPEEIWKIVAEHLQGTDLNNLSKVSDVCHQAALREKNIQEMNSAVKELQALSNLHPAAPKGSQWALDVYVCCLLYLDDFPYYALHPGTAIDPAKLSQLKHLLELLATTQVAARFRELKRSCYQEIIDNQATYESIEEKYIDVKCSLVTQALEYRINSSIDPKQVRGVAVRCAAEKCHVGLVEALLANKAEICPSLRGEALDKAAQAGHLYLVRLLLQDGEIFDVSRGLATISAVKNPHPQIVEALIAHGKVYDEHMGIAIKHAAEKGYYGVVRALLANSAMITKEAKSKAIQLALQAGHKSIAKLLTQH